MVKIGNDWDKVLEEEWEKEYFKALWRNVEKEYEGAKVFPPKDRIFEALQRTSLKSTKVVILGQDPYHKAGQAHGLAFSVEQGTQIPPSLRNIYKELQDDLGHPAPSHGSLGAWADRGVLLLNTVLTVEEGRPLSHRKWGWERFTSRILEELSKRPKPMAFLLWGAAAGEKAAHIGSHHGVFLSAHPSPLSARRGFFGSRPFSRADAFLKATGQEPVDWHLD